MPVKLVLTPAAFELVCGSLSDGCDRLELKFRIFRQEKKWTGNYIYLQMLFLHLPHHFLSLYPPYSVFECAVRAYINNQQTH